MCVDSVLRRGGYVRIKESEKRIGERRRDNVLD